MNPIDPDPTPETLLHRFVKNDHAEESFRSLVEQQSSLVLGTATRQLNGDHTLAEDVSQDVFKLLARKAARLDGTVSVAGWLYRQACRQSVDRQRSESRRHKREKKAYEMMTAQNDPPERALISEIDEALLSLPEDSRDAVIMRYLEGRTHRSLGQHFGISEEAVRKRITRAIKSLKSFLGERGIKTSISGLAAGLTTLGTEPVRAATSTHIATLALQQTTLKTGTLSLSVLTAGLLATSAIAVGLRSVAQTPEQSPAHLADLPAKSLRSLNPPHTFSSLTPPILRDGGFENVIAGVKELSHRPQHEITKVFLHDLLDQITDAQIPAFIEASKDSFSQSERVAYFYLLNRWGESDPEAAVTYALREDISTLLGQGSTLINDLVDLWAESNPVEAMHWVLDEWSNPHWEAVHGMPNVKYGKVDTGGLPNIQTVAWNLTNQLRSEQSIAPILDRVQNLPKNDKYAMLHLLSISSSLQQSAYLELSQVVHDLDRSPESQFLRHLFWHRRAKSHQESPSRQDQILMNEIFENLNLPAQYKAELAMINLPHREDSIEKIFEAGSALRLEDDDILKEIAESYLAAPFEDRTHDLAISQWLGDHASHLNLDEAILNRIERGDDRFESWTDENSEANAMLLSLSLSDPVRAYRLARTHFENLLTEAPGDVPYFLRIFPLPEELQQEFLARYQQTDLGPTR